MADNTKYAALEIAKDIANAKLPDFDAALQQARRNRAAAERVSHGAKSAQSAEAKPLPSQAGRSKT